MKILFCGFKVLLDDGGGAIIDKDLSSDPLTDFACWSNCIGKKAAICSGW